MPSQLKWAKCNIGATNEEDAGLYFQWGDTQGYTAEQVGDGEGLKAFDWDDCKFWTGNPSSKFSKYNASDSKTVLELEDDAAHVNMGGNWRIPTFDECKELYFNTDIYLVPTEGEEIQGTAQEQSMGITINWVSQAEGTLKGVKFYKKGDKQTYMFVPVAGNAYNGSLNSVGKYGCLWASLLFPNGRAEAAYGIGFNSGGGFIGSSNRYWGQPIRGVMAQ